MTTNIAVCGRTNVGKTAFITTIRNNYSGEILDKSNTTTEISDFPHDILNIILSDFPGFEKMGAVEALMNLKKDEDFIKFEKENPALATKFKNATLGGKLSKRDFDLIEELKSKDVVFLVCSVESYPEATHIAEIELVKDANPNIIAIISKTGIYENRERAEAWIKSFKEFDIKHIIEFDAHFDHKSKISDLMGLCLNYLTDSAKIEKLTISIKTFNESIQNQHNEIRNSFVEFIVNAASLEMTSDSKSGIESKVTGFKNIIANSFKKYTDLVVSTLNINIQEFNDLAQTARININEVRTPYEVLEIAIPAVTRGASMIVLGIIAAANPLVGLAGAVYYAFKGDEIENQVSKIAPTKSSYTIKLTTTEINEIANLGVLIYWLASKFGYARRYKNNETVDLTITKRDIQEFHSRLLNVSPVKRYSRDELKTWFDSAMNQIEQKKQ